MSSSSDASPASGASTAAGDRYHHGDLRNALLQNARALLADEGVAKLSLRAVARRSGVSHAAAYHHFASKADLLAAVAVAAFARLEGATRAATAGRDDPAERLRAFARAYLDFALEHPAEFRLMFSPSLRSDEVRTDVERAGRASYEALIETLERLHAAGRLPGGDPEGAAIALWSLVHGVATLMLDGPLYRNAHPAEAREALLERVADRVLAGLSPPAD